MTRKSAERKRQPFIRRGAESDEIWLEDLRGAVWNSNRDKGVLWKDIAQYRKPFLATSTVAKFAYGDTKRPVFRTIFRICEALDIQITFRARS